MRQAAQAIVDFTAGASLETYRRDRMLRRAVERELEIIGEAARRLSEAFRDAHPEIPWGQIVGLRNLIAHGYDRVDDERVWRLAIEEVPVLVGQLRALVPPAPAEPDA
jgi:uncharacterized protein with HEPN domain